MTKIEKTEMIVARMAERRAEINRLKDLLEPLEYEMEQDKLSLIRLMQASHSKRTETINGIYVSRGERRNVAVTDREAVIGYLDAADLPVEDYLKIDTARIKSLADSALKETGELIPGLEVTTTEYLTIREGK